MVVAADEREAHVVGDAGALEGEAAGLHATGGRDGAEPVDVVLGDEQTTRGHEGGEQVVVGGDGVGRADVLVELGAEPHVLAHDLVRRLDILPFTLLRVGDAPAGGAAGAGLLGQRQGDALDEGADDEGALAVARAARRRETGRVDAGLVGAELLEAVDESVDAPGPGRQGAGRMRVAEERVEGAGAAGVGLAGPGVVAEVDGADGGGDGERGAADGDDGGTGRRAAALADARADRGRLGADGDLHREGTPGQCGLDLVGRRRVVAELILLQDLKDLGLAALPVGLRGDLAAVGEGERVGQLGVVDGWVAVLDGAIRAVLSRVDLGVGEGPC